MFSDPNICEGRQNERRCVLARKGLKHGCHSIHTVPWPCHIASVLRVTPQRADTYNYDLLRVLLELSSSSNLGFSAITSRARKVLRNQKCKCRVVSRSSHLREDKQVGIATVYHSYSRASSDRMSQYVVLVLVLTRRASPCHTDTCK